MEHSNPKIYMDAVLTPNRSLSPRAFTIVMAIVGGMSFIAGLAFVSMGAFPVIGFFGIDALAIWLAFRFSRRALRQETRVKITAETIELIHHQPGKAAREATIPTAFARVKLDYPERRPSELQIAYQQQAWVIGRFLTPGERKKLKAALETAIHSARMERYPV
jgi:uncharacterized membrane protein